MRGARGFNERVYQELKKKNKALVTLRIECGPIEESPLAVCGFSGIDSAMLFIGALAYPDGTIHIGHLPGRDLITFDADLVAQLRQWFTHLHERHEV